MTKHDKFLIGWEEWCALPELGLPAIKAKIDTGARTSAIHAFDIMSFLNHGEVWVEFSIHPLQKDTSITKNCQARVIDKRYVMSSNGHKESRYVIQTTLGMGEYTWPIEVTLSNRDPLAFRMLLGREALRSHVVIDPTKSFVSNKITKTQLEGLYPQPT